MFPCSCGKQSYATAHAVYAVLRRQRTRKKSGRRSKRRLTRETTQIDAGQVGAYRCPTSGQWHMGHDSAH